MASQRQCRSDNHDTVSHWRRPLMVRIYTRSSTPIPDPKHPYRNKGTKRSWDPIGHICSDLKC